MQASRAWKKTSGFCAVPRMMGRSGLSALLTELDDVFVVEDGANGLVGDGFDLADFVRSAEAVEEVDERNARFEGGDLRDEREVGDFLDRIGREHGPARGAASHHIGVVAED